jgi:regulator of protease activity HflC (stomatin/prohibitin superfamily)
MGWLTVTVNEPNKAVELVRGRFRRVLSPGRYWRPRGARYLPVNMAERLTVIGLQEVRTNDGIQVRVSAAVRWRVDDPRPYVTAAEDPVQLVYLAVQLALRDQIARLEAEDLARRQDEGLAGALTEAAVEAGRPLGMVIEDVQVKDVLMPSEVREANQELLVAKLRAAAQLESARAETAALRSLANGAKLLEDHPALERLRMVQSLPVGSAVKLVLPPT